ncbi:MAG: substrate-binding domain-containing protein [Anaerolineae bacterium]|nr:substrate-binding domain-containing protein [Anaerolineae bacterium]
MPSTQDALAVDIMGGVEHVAKQHDYHVVFAFTQNQPEQETLDIQRMRRQHVAGLVVFPVSNLTRDETIVALVSDDMPLALVDRYFPDLPTDVVTVDNFGGGHMLTRHLVDLGHRRIGFVTPDDLTTTSVRDRFQGYRRALDEHHLTYEDRLFLRIPGDLTGYLQAADRPTAVFAANDFTAIEVIRAANALGLRVPEDLSVVGFDDIREASQLSVPLTTVRQSGRKVGQRACELLLERLVTGRRTPKHEVLPVQLIVRRSSGAK